MSTPRLPRRGKRGGDGGAPPAHPLERAIEQLYTSGATPRLVMDARRVDVVVPDFVRARWGAQLVIDLDASYPLDLAYDADGVHASLAFSGVVTRCTFGWASIYRVIDRASGRGIEVPAHQPPAELPPELAYVMDEPRPVTEVVESKKPTLAAVPAAAPKKDPAPASTTSDEAAKARRAKFRVIDGG